MSRGDAALGLDVGSTTVKAVLVRADRIIWRDYRRHYTRQAETVLGFLERLEREAGLRPGHDRICCTGSGAGSIAPLLGAAIVQEVVAVMATVQRLHPEVRFVSEIGGEDMKTLFLHPAADTRSKQIFMQSACSGGTGAFIEKASQKLGIDAARLAGMPYDGVSLHRVSAKCGIFAEADANTLLKSGIPAGEIIASLFEAVVHQNLATLTKGLTPKPGALLLGGPNLFYRGLQQAWRRHLTRLWAEREVALPSGSSPETLVQIPADALYYAALGCLSNGADGCAVGDPVYRGTGSLKEWIDRGQHAQKARDGCGGLAGSTEEIDDFRRKYATTSAGPRARGQRRPANKRAVRVGCDFGSTTAKAAVLDADGDLLFSSYALSRGNPIEDAQALFQKIRDAGFHRIGALAVTGYGKDLLQRVLGADLALVETVAHAQAALHYFPDAEVICDVGGCDVKILLLQNGTVVDFRLNSQCSAGTGAFLQNVAERYGVPIEDYAARAFTARAMPRLAMGCAVFLQSDIVNQQRKGWSAEEIMAALAAVLPINVWVYAAQLHNLRGVGRRFVLQGGVHRNLAVVKAQADFLSNKVPGVEILIHPHPGEAGAIGAALATRCHEGGSRFHGYAAVAAARHHSTTNEATVCPWCPSQCRRTFIDVQIPGARGNPRSKVPLSPGWERIISGHGCQKGLVEDAAAVRAVKNQDEEARRAYPNLADLVRGQAFRAARAAG